MSRETILVHPEKADSPIAVTDSGRMTPSNDSQSWNAVAPTPVTVYVLPSKVTSSGIRTVPE